MQIDESLLERVRLYALASEKKSRFEHSVRVAQTAERMCGVYGVDPAKGYFAALAHDMCKDLEDTAQLSMASRDGEPVTDVERDKPALLHGRAAAVKLREDFGVDDSDILEAVARHTFGGEGMCVLAKIIYAADKIEPGRPNSSPERIASLLGMSLDGMCLAVAEESLEYLRSRGKKVAPATLRFLQSLRDSQA